MVKQRQRVGLAAAKLRGEIEDGVGFRFLAGQTADDFGRETGEILGEIGALEKSFRLLVISGRLAFAHLIQMDGEFRRVERFALAQIFARGDDFIPRFRGHIKLDRSHLTILRSRNSPNKAFEKVWLRLQRIRSE